MFVLGGHKIEEWGVIEANAYEFCDQGGATEALGREERGRARVIIGSRIFQENKLFQKQVQNQSSWIKKSDQRISLSC